MMTLSYFPRACQFMRRASEFLAVSRVWSWLVCYPGSELHPLHGQWTGFWAVKVSGNWRVIFHFEEGNASQVNSLDYHS